MFFELNGIGDVLRVMCGAFFLPHLAIKILHPERPLEFFAAARLKPGRLVLNIAIVTEALFAAALIFNVYARQAAIAAAAFLLVAAAALMRVNKGEWLWNRGGPEYAVFWSLCCLLVAFGT
jgi:putative oxidoreductase